MRDPRKIVLCQPSKFGQTSSVCHLFRYVDVAIQILSALLRMASGLHRKRFSEHALHRFNRAPPTWRAATRAPGGELDLAAYAISYDMDLWSNFTCFLDDPVNGGQFRKKWTTGNSAASPLHNIGRQGAGVGAWVPRDITMTDERIARPSGCLF